MPKLGKPLEPCMNQPSACVKMGFSWFAKLPRNQPTLTSPKQTPWPETTQGQLKPKPNLWDDVGRPYQFRACATPPAKQTAYPRLKLLLMDLMRFAKHLGSERWQQEPDANASDQSNLTLRNQTYSLKPNARALACATRQAASLSPKTMFAHFITESHCAPKNSVCVKTRCPKMCGCPLGSQTSLKRVPATKGAAPSQPLEQAKGDVASFWDSSLRFSVYGCVFSSHVVLVWY